MKFALVSAFLGFVAANVDVQSAFDLSDAPNFAAYMDAVNVADASDVAAVVDQVDICATAEFPDQCHATQCTWCKSLRLDNPEKSGCKSKKHAKIVQGTARFFCNIDATSYQCNGKNEAYCNTDSNCVWCEHSSIGKACFTVAQANLIPHKQVCPKLAKY
eukprot:GDKJ01035108.1.p1 GENE.GDKJ01035108.1~~GDKJ01035108.1.p1  ORF type:complete len:160 (+),score=32.60 GDKJ01035108.1:17-496(+)